MQHKICWDITHQVWYNADMCRSRHCHHCCRHVPCSPPAEPPTAEGGMCERKRSCQWCFVFWHIERCKTEQVTQQNNTLKDWVSAAGICGEETGHKVMLHMCHLSRLNADRCSSKENSAWGMKNGVHYNAKKKDDSTDLNRIPLFFITFYICVKTSTF